jgi:hypothetical protein
MLKYRFTLECFDKLDHLVLLAILNFWISTKNIKLCSGTFIKKTCLILSQNIIGGTKGDALQENLFFLKWLSACHYMVLSLHLDNLSFFTA